MKKIACLLILSMALVGSVSAYQMYWEVPRTMNVGEPIVIEGTSTLPPGYSTEVVFYMNKPFSRELDRAVITIQEGGTWSATFETEALPAGDYQIEIVTKIDYPLGSDTDTLKLVTLIDRSGEIDLSSPLTQEFDGSLEIAGKATKVEDQGIQITVTGSSGVVFGPGWVPTDANGYFTKTVAIPKPGYYSVKFSDSNGYITTVSVQATSATQPTTKPSSDVKSASAMSSQQSPAYFAVDTKGGLVTIRTSSGVDWIMEYIDEGGVKEKINTQGRSAGEEATIPARGGVVYVKVYPVLSTDAAMIELTAENADAITMSNDAAALFGDEPVESPTQETPLPLCISLIALLIAGFVGYRR